MPKRTHFIRYRASRKTEASPTSVPVETAEEAIRAAQHEGLKSGIASVLYPLGRGRPAPPRVKRGLGSLREDERAISRDGKRLFNTAR